MQPEFSMTNTLMNYTTRAKVEQFLNRVFNEVSNTEFDGYLKATEASINNYLGYNSETTTSGILSESINREKLPGKIDNDGNLVIDVTHPPVNFDANGNPLVTLVEYNFGGVRVPLQLTDGTNNSLNTLLEVSENRRKIIYPSMYFLPYISTVTPTQKVNLYNLRDVKFWVDVSYIGGFSQVPADITLAANMIMSDFLTRRDNPNFATSIRQGSYSIDFGSGGADGRAFASAKKLLDPYVRYTW